ncbi:MAG: aspartate 1-decarboxylase, partial [Hyphomicrobiaceae bacterium]|nr:aspartate 1-decarboxylase [Hyphomicrobiaceae bacterium]
GDKIIICAYSAMTEEEAKTHKPRVIILDDDNKFECVSTRPINE